MIGTFVLCALLQAVPGQAAPAGQPAGEPAGAPAAPAGDTRPITVASKPFAESYLLAEMFAQLLEARGFRVDRRPGLGATEIAFGALRTGAIDVYPEYTGTGLLAILHEQPEHDARAVFRRVATEFPQRFDVFWLPPLGFENTYAIAVRQETATQHGLRTLTDLSRAAPGLTAGLTPDFVGRPDGLPGLRQEYALRFAAVRSLLQSVKYTALVNGNVDVIDGYSTDGLIARHGLVVLIDDRGFFPAYEAAALVNGSFYREFPHAVAVLTELSGRIDLAFMQRLNERVEARGEGVPQVASAALRELGLLAPSTDADSVADSASTSLLRYFIDQRALLATLTLRHLLLVLVSLAGAIAVAVPLGLALERAGNAAEPVIRAVGVLQTIPGIALIAFMIPLLGIGVVPALVALFLYSLYPILRNTYTGVRDAAPDAVAAAHALGMTPRQVLRLVRLPLASPIIMAGIRTAAVIAVGTATLAAFIGAGGLGDPIVSGLALSDTRMILFGAIPAAALALLVDTALGRLAERLRAERLGG
jgi:osmoprotectant transport system permease protein